MKAIFLNCWHAKIKEKLFDFILKNSSSVDIFCFQELDKKFFDELQTKLKNFKGVYQTKRYINDWNFHQAIFVKNNFEFETITVGCQAVKIKSYQSVFFVYNVHGVSLPGDKNDSKERLEQSRQIIDLAQKFSIPAIIGGDFNLNPNTQSIKMFDETDYVNLIKEYKIKSTRNHFAWEQAQEQLRNEGREFYGKQYYADYCFVTHDIKVKTFAVPDPEVSDHLPLILEFEV